MSFTPGHFLRVPGWRIQVPVKLRFDELIFRNFLEGMPKGDLGGLASHTFTLG